MPSQSGVNLEITTCLLAGDLDTGKAILRDHINATIGFEELSRLTRVPAKSLMRMLGPNGNPQARNLFEVIRHLQRAEGLHFELLLKAS
jgi:DNA-binding phage protein